MGPSAPQVAARIPPFQQRDGYPAHSSSSGSSQWPSYGNNSDTSDQYKANNPSVFTTDPQLHSQFIKFAQTNPVGNQPSPTGRIDGPQVSPKIVTDGSKSIVIAEESHSAYGSRFITKDQGNNISHNLNQPARYSNLPYPLHQNPRGPGQNYPPTQGTPENSSRSPHFNFSPTELSGFAEYPTNQPQGFTNSPSCSYSQNSNPRQTFPPPQSSNYNPSRSQPMHEFVPPPSTSNVYAQQQYAHQMSPTRPRFSTCSTQQPPTRWMSIAPSGNEGSADSSQVQRTSMYYSQRAVNPSTNQSHRQYVPRSPSDPSSMHHMQAGLRVSHPHRETYMPYTVPNRPQNLPTDIHARSSNVPVSPNRPNPPTSTTFPQCQYEYKSPVSENLPHGTGQPSFQPRIGQTNEISGNSNPTTMRGTDNIPPWPSNLSHAPQTSTDYHHRQPQPPVVSPSKPGVLSQQYYHYDASKSTSVTSYGGSSSQMQSSSSPHPNGTSYPVICRVSPLRFRYDQGSINEGYHHNHPQSVSSSGSDVVYNSNMNFKSGGNNIVSSNRASTNHMHSLSYPSPSANPIVRHPYGPPIPNNPSISPAQQHRPGPFESGEEFGYRGNHPGGPSYYGSSSTNRPQYHGMRAGYRPVRN
jgi:hypothetical protein